MNQNFLQNNPKKHSPIPLIHEMTCIYIILHNTIRTFPKMEKYSIGITLEKTLLECIKQIFLATVIPPSEQKFQAISQASALFDTLKLMTRMTIDIHCTDDKTYLKLLPHFGESGKMIGGWLKEAKKSIDRSNPTDNQTQPQNQS